MQSEIATRSSTVDEEWTAGEAAPTLATGFEAWRPFGRPKCGNRGTLVGDHGESSPSPHHRSATGEAHRYR